MVARELVTEPVSTRPIAVGTAAGLVLRVGWIAARLMAVLYLGGRGAMFFYQGF